MSSLKNSVHATLVDGDTVVCIHNVEYNARGRDIGGKIYLDVESLDWLITTLREYLLNGIAQRRAFTQDDLEVTFAGPDYQPLLAILSRRGPEAKHGGTTGETMDPELVPALITEFETLRDQLNNG